MKRDDILLKHKEATKLGALEFLLDRKQTAAQTAARLKLSIRQIFRLKAKFEQGGAAALVHGNRGRQPAHTLHQAIRQTIAELAKGDYRGASLNQMSELLLEREKIRVCAKSVGNILKDNGIKNPHTHKAPRQHPTRDRRPREGELVQIDASEFDWFETGENYNLHGAIDDATGKVLGARFEPTETMKGYIHVLEDMVKKHGVPDAMYSDRKTILFSQLHGKLSEEDEMEGRKAPLTQYGRMLWDLGIRHIAAYSPQAKGRIERLWGTFQSRLVVELRLAKIKTLEEANEFMKTYLDKHNQRFAVEAREPGSVFIPCPDEKILSVILSVQRERQSTGGSEISFEGTRYQLAKGTTVILMRKGDKVTVLRSVDGTLRGIWNGEIYDLVKSPVAVSPAEKTSTKKPDKPERKKHVPPPDHPWRRWYGEKSANRLDPDWRETTAL